MELYIKHCKKNLNMGAEVELERLCCGESCVTIFTHIGP